MIYAINKRTKEHRVWNPKKGPLSIEEVVCHADADGWVPWEGGECPLPDGVAHEVQIRDSRPQTWRWGNSGSDGGIIAYRPILDADEPAEPEAVEWDGVGLPPVGIRCEALRSDGWREVYIVGYCEDGYCVMDTGSEFKGNKDPAKFRPLRTAAQRAEEEEFNQAMRDVDPEADEHRPHVESVVYRMIRAGYRKR